MPRGGYGGLSTSANSSFYQLSNFRFIYSCLNPEGLPKQPQYCLSVSVPKGLKIYYEEHVSISELCGGRFDPESGFS